MSTAREQITITGGQLLTFALLFSVALHFTLVFVARHLPPLEISRPQPKEVFIEVDLVNALQVVDSNQQAADEAPDRADFASDRNLRADEETSPPPQSLVPQQGSQSAPPGEVIESFSLSSSEMAQSQVRELPDSMFSTGDVQKRFSPEFLERLKRGEELKLNAFGLDYAAYLNRMRERIRNRWNPMRYFQADMRRYDRVSTSVVLVLNSDGEVKNWDILSPTLFRDYDEHAMDVLVDSGPYPNPPRSLIQDDGLIYLTWTFVLYTNTWGAAVD